MFDEIKFLQKIDKNISLWNFDFVEKELFLNYKKSKTVEDRFLSFLYYTGNFNKYYIESDCINHFYLQAISKIKSMQIDLDKIENNFIYYKDLPKDIVLCMVFNKICEYCKEFNIEHFLHLYRIYIFSSKNKLTKNYFVAKLIETCVSEGKQNCFFVKELIDVRYYLLIQLFRDDSKGSKRYYEIFIREVESLLRVHGKHQPKIAVCMYGPLRGDWKATMEHNLKILLKELKADIFIFTWSQRQTWQRMSAGGDSWADRKLSKELIAQCPKEIYFNKDFKQNFPNTWKKLDQDIYCDLEQQELESFKLFYSNIKKIVIEDQDTFEKEKIDVVALKMYYGIFRSFELLKEYEYNIDIKYDYVISMRSDCEIISNGNIKEEILSLKSLNILDIHTPAGSGVGNVIGCRNTIEIYSSLYKNRYFFNNAMMFDYKSPHGVFFKWLAYNGIYTTKRRFDIEHRYTSCMKGYKIPPVAKELFLDMQKLKNILDEERFNNIVCFFKSVLEYFNGIDVDNIFFSAKARIQNQLSYKLGQAMIANSKSLLGYIRMPFILFCVKNKHKHEQKIYQEKIKKDPSLKLPPLENYLDYKEAIRERECLTYKLGQALIRANDTWYMGGFIKLLFEIGKLKKEYRDKRKIF